MELNDINYGKIILPTDMAAIVSTPIFQRLKSIKQVGFLKINNVLEYEHTRYQHCIGTYYAACQMLDALEKNTPWLADNNNKIPPLYRKAVQVAALLHDVGHGPFSHSWERVVETYNHEKVGFPCIDEIFKILDEQLFPELRNNNNFGIELIKALIEGDINKLSQKIPENFRFIFEIVSNKQCKLDIDKWDYLKRDYNYLNHICSPDTDFEDVFLKSRVSSCGSHIEYRYEDYDKIYKLFAARYYFHVDCYSLPPYLICDHILKLAVDETNPTINNKLVTEIDSETMPEFLQLTDNNVLDLIQDSELSAFLEYDTKFQQLDVDELQNAASFTTIDVPSVSEYMPKDKDLHFYGDIKDKPIVKDQTVHVHKIYRFYCDKSTKTVYYSVQHIK